MKCALVTGSSRGIGRAIAVQLAKDLGIHILINYASNDAAAAETKAFLQKPTKPARMIRLIAVHIL